MGLSEAGFDVVLAVDNDEEALETHRANHPGLSANWDLADAEVVERVAEPRQDGAACRSSPAGLPVSRSLGPAGRWSASWCGSVGARAMTDDATCGNRSSAWSSWRRPPAVVMENVPDMALDRGMVILAHDDRAP